MMKILKFHKLHLTHYGYDPNALKATAESLSTASTFPILYEPIHSH